MDLIEKLDNLINETESTNIPEIFPKKSTPYILFALLDHSGNLKCYGQFINNLFVDDNPQDLSLPIKCFKIINILLNFSRAEPYYPEVLKGSYRIQEGNLYYALATNNNEDISRLKGYLFRKIFSDITKEI